MLQLYFPELVDGIENKNAVQCLFDVLVCW